jgi:hypothetical protein
MGTVTMRSGMWICFGCSMIARITRRCARFVGPSREVGTWITAYVRQCRIRSSENPASRNML